MIIFYIFLFLFILIGTGALFYLYDFFIPSLRAKYGIISQSLDTVTSSTVVEEDDENLSKNQTLENT